MNDLTGKYYDASLFADYKADVEQPLPMIYQSGYLTIKDYDRFTSSYLLDFPNNEVRRGFLSLIATGYFKMQPTQVMGWLAQAMRDLHKSEAKRS